MSDDSIYLEVNGRQVRHFISYRVEADLYVADHAFSLEIGLPEFDISLGARCRLLVNDQEELTGIVDRRCKRTDKNGSRMTIEGRDLMGLVVDSYCEQFVTVEGKKLSELAHMLLKDIPFINSKRILYQKDLVGKLKTRRSRDASYGLEGIMGADGAERIAQIHPGMSKFQVLSMYAISRGQMFYMLPNGTFVFGRPLVGGDPEYEIVFNPEGLGNNVLMAEEDANISQRYSKVTVVGQQQADTLDGLDAGKVNISGTVTDPSFPFYKPFVQLSHNDSQTPKQHARLLMDKQRHDGYRLSYQVPRHSQNGRNFTINKVARVADTVHGVHGSFLVSGRSFQLDKSSGSTTLLKLSPLGLIEDAGKLAGGRR